MFSIGYRRAYIANCYRESFQIALFAIICLFWRPTTFSFISGLVTFGSIWRWSPVKYLRDAIRRSSVAQREILRKSSPHVSGRQELDGSKILIFHRCLSMSRDLLIADNWCQRRCSSCKPGAICVNHLQGHGQVRKQVSERCVHQTVCENCRAKGERFFGWELLRHR